MQEKSTSVAYTVQLQNNRTAIIRTSQPPKIGDMYQVKDCFDHWIQLRISDIRDEILYSESSSVEFTLQVDNDSPVQITTSNEIHPGMIIAYDDLDHHRMVIQVQTINKDVITASYMDIPVVEEKAKHQIIM